MLEPHALRVPGTLCWLYGSRAMQRLADAISSIRTRWLWQVRLK